MSNLDLGIIGNGAISALVDRWGTVVWYCNPRFDGDPMFCARQAAERVFVGGIVSHVDGDDLFAPLRQALE